MKYDGFNARGIHGDKHQNEREYVLGGILLFI